MATNTKKVKGLQIPFKEFMPGQLIISSQFNDDMKDIEDKVNEIIDEHNVMSEEIDAHTDNTENPHQVNAHQVGTYDSGEIDEFVNDLRNGEFNDNVIENNVLADDCIDTRNYRDASITPSKVEPSFGSQLDISENIEIKTRYTKQETDELIKTKVGDGTYSKEELDTKFEEVQAGVIIDSTIGIEKLKSNIGNEIDISQNVSITNRYMKDEVDYLIRTNALPRDWGSILEADENESFQSNDTGIFPVADYMVSDMFVSPASNVLDFDIKEVVDSRNGYDSLNDRLNAFETTISSLRSSIDNTTTEVFNVNGRIDSTLSKLKQVEFDVEELKNKPSIPTEIIEQVYKNTEDNKKQNFYINALFKENINNRLSIKNSGNIVKLEGSKEGLVEIEKIVGNTMTSSNNIQSTFEDKLITQEMINNGFEKQENLGKYKACIKIIGKNKVDFKNIKVLNNNSSTYEIIDNGLRIRYNGNNTSTSKSYTYIRSELYDINPNTKRLILSYKHSSNKNQKPKILVKLFDSKASPTSIKDYSVTGFTNMDIPQNAKYYQLVIYSCSGDEEIVKGDYVDYIDVQLEEVFDSSINTTQYEPYKECITNVYLNSPLAKGDEIVAKEDGLYHYHKMKKVALDNNSKLSMPNSIYQPTNTNYVIFGYEDNTIKTNVNCHCDRFNVLPSSTVSKNLANEGIWVHSTTNSIRICVLKSKLTSIDVSGFNKWLQDNPITIIYELTKPYYEKISDDKFISKMSSKATLYIDSVIPCQSVRVSYTGNVSNGLNNINTIIEKQKYTGVNILCFDGQDETEKFQNALNSDYHILIVPEIQITRPLTIPYNSAKKIIGIGGLKRTAIRVNFNENYKERAVFEYLTNERGEHNWGGLTIEHIHLVGNNCKTNGIKIQYGCYVLFNNVLIEGFNGSGLILDKCQDSSFNNLIIQSCGRSTGDVTDNKKTTHAPLELISTIENDHNNMLRFNDIQIEQNNVSPYIRYSDGGGIGIWFDKCHFEIREEKDFNKFDLFEANGGDIEFSNTNVSPTFRNGFIYKGYGKLSFANCRALGNIKFDNDGMNSSLNMSNCIADDVKFMSANGIQNIINCKITNLSLSYPSGVYNVNDSSIELVEINNKGHEPKIYMSNINGKHLYYNTGAEGLFLINSHFSNTFKFAGALGASICNTHGSHVEINKIDNSFVPKVKIVYTDNVPQFGYWEKGSKIINTNPIGGGNIGWVCVEDGSPGIWKAYGSIEH